MKIITVIPLARGIFKETLTYFSAHEVPLGSVITVPIRKKKIDALVIKSENLASSKSLLKNSAFSLKKIGDIKGLTVLPDNFLRAAFKVRNYSASTSGNVLAAVLPKIFLESYDKLTLPKNRLNEKKNIKQEKLVLQAQLPERLSYYKTFIRESFARKKYIFMCLPTIKDAEFFRDKLSKGIENYVYIFHNEIPKKEFIARFNSLSLENHPVLVIATPPYLFLINDNYGAVIIEHESSTAYKMPGRPYLDMRTWAEIVTSDYNTKLIFADTLLRIETLWRFENFELSEAIPLSFRLSNTLKKELVDMKEKGKPFGVFSKQLEETLASSEKNGGRSFLFVGRKGLASITICNDCSSPVLCATCTKPLVLYGDEKNRVLMCHNCKTKTDAQMKCGTCDSWNLKALGIGTDLVYEELRNKFPDRIIFRIDKDNSKTAKESKNIVTDFYNTKGSIMIGTEMALHYLKGEIENVAVVSFDSLFSIPDFRINEKIMQLLVNLEGQAKNNLFIQTRNQAAEVLQQYFLGNLSQFVRSELKVREDLSYPPFGTLIKIVYKGPKNNIDKAREYLESFFRQYNPFVFQAFVSRAKNLYVLNVVLKIKRSNWSLPEIASGGNLNQDLLLKLMSLPPALSVEVDPDSLL
jgi:primosomal protein N' (replication factor Y)